MTIASMTVLSAPRNEVIASLFARYYPVDEPLFGRSQLMDRRGSGVRMILERSLALSGKRPVYENLDDRELLLTLYAAPAPEGTGAGTRTTPGLGQEPGQNR